MKRIFILLLFASLYAFPQIKIDFEKYVLPNGLQVILHRDTSVPLVSTNIWYHVGSAREKPGKTGFAHLFEHLMYEGSENVPDGRYDEIVDGSGGLNNGSTSNDRTNYWTIVPKNYLEPVLWLESDRMGYLLGAITQERLDIQRAVVKNERRQSYENQPYGMVYKMILEAIYPPDFPYHWLTIGSQEDLDSASLDDVKEFFKNFYGPNNASLCIGGDIDIEETKKLVEKYFSDIPTGPPVPKSQPVDHKLNNTKRLILEDKVELPRLYMFWLSVPDFSKDDAALSLLGEILANGKNSRLYKSLVYEKQIAQEVFAFQQGMELSGLFGIVVTGKPDQSLKELEAEVREQLNILISKGVDDKELQRCKNIIKANFLYRLQQVGGFGSKTDQLNYYNVFLGDPGKFNYDLERYQNISKNDIKIIAKKYLLESNAVILSVVPVGRKDLKAGE